MKNERFIIPQKNTGIIATVENNSIKETGTIDIPYASKSVFLENRLFVSLCFGAKPKSSRLKIFDETGKQIFRKPEYKYRSINAKGTAVYLGGRYKANQGKLCSIMDAQTAEIKEIALPVRFKQGKAIDDILIRGNDLYLVDNIVYPKYIFTYDISVPPFPRHANTRELEANGTYEHIIKGDINENYLLLFSSTVGMRGYYQHISILQIEPAMKLLATLTCHVEGIFTPLRNSKILDTCIISNCIIILNEDGLKIAKLEPDMNEIKVRQLNANEKNYSNLLKIDQETFIAYNQEGYELLVLPKRNIL